MIATERLFLREWRDSDVEAFIVMNADPLVMEFFPETYSEERTRRFVDRIRECWAERGYGLWAVERKWPATFPPTSPQRWRSGGASPRTSRATDTPPKRRAPR